MRRALQSCFIVFLFVTPATTPGFLYAQTLLEKPLKGRIIVLDPGHAVLDSKEDIINPGARARHGVYERDAALAIALKLEPLLEAQGAKVYMTRTAMNPWRYGERRQADNRGRAIFANVMGAQAYVRLHCDWNRNRKFKGITTYYFRWGSRSLAHHIHRALIKELQHHDNGVHRRTFVSVTARMPTVLLELGVLSNKLEGKELALDSYQARLAQAIDDGIVSYFQQRGTTKDMGPSLMNGTTAQTTVK